MEKEPTLSKHEKGIITINYRISDQWLQVINMYHNNYMYTLRCPVAVFFLKQAQVKQVLNHTRVARYKNVEKMHCDCWITLVPEPHLTISWTMHHDGMLC